MRRFINGVFLVLLNAACQQNQGGVGPTDVQVRDGGADGTPPADAQVQNGSADGIVLNLPAGCPPDAGNELSIGKPCSKTGNECASSNLRCTCGDFGIVLPVNMPCYCTNVTAAASCPANSNCGSNATCCSLMGLVTGCVPDVCLAGNQCPVFQ